MPALTSPHIITGTSVGSQMHLHMPSVFDSAVTYGLNLGCDPPTLRIERMFKIFVLAAACVALIHAEGTVSAFI